MRRGLNASTEARFRNDLMRYAQGQHLAAPFFSIDEIVVKPGLLTPSIEFQQVNKIEETDKNAS